MIARIAVVVGVLAAPLSFAQQFHAAVPVAGAPMPAVIQVQVGRPLPAPLRQGGRWELRTSQQWVPGATQQVWVNGQCTSHPRRPWVQRCTQGRYVTQQLPGRYETVQQWVWVDRFDDRRYGRRDDDGYGRRYGRR